jgi:hypothetical protein
VVVGAEVIFVVELARVAFVADCAVEEADCCREGVVSLHAVLSGCLQVSLGKAYWRHDRVCVKRNIPLLF